MEAGDGALGDGGTAGGEAVGTAGSAQAPTSSTMRNSKTSVLRTINLPVTPTAEVLDLGIE